MLRSVALIVVPPPLGQFVRDIPPSVTVFTAIPLAARLLATFKLPTTFKSTAWVAMIPVLVSNAKTMVRVFMVFPFVGDELRV